MWPICLGPIGVYFPQDWPSLGPAPSQFLNISYTAKPNYPGLILFLYLPVRFYLQDLLVLEVLFLGRYIQDSYLLGPVPELQYLPTHNYHFSSPVSYTHLTLPTIYSV